MPRYLVCLPREGGTEHLCTLPTRCSMALQVLPGSVYRVITRSRALALPTYLVSMGLWHYSMAGSSRLCTTCVCAIRRRGFLK